MYYKEKIDKRVRYSRRYNIKLGAFIIAIIILINLERFKFHIKVNFIEKGLQIC